MAEVTKWVPYEALCDRNCGGLASWSAHDELPPDALDDGCDPLVGPKTLKVIVYDVQCPSCDGAPLLHDERASA